MSISPAPAAPEAARELASTAAVENAEGDAGPPTETEEAIGAAPGAAPRVFPVTAEAPVVLELFSSQACVFCPRADQLFAQWAARENVIALACHVDYFDVKEGALSHPFCTQRQNFYGARLGSGPNYTPQIVIDGMREAVGYEAETLSALIEKRVGGPAAIGISPAEKSGESGKPGESEATAGTFFTARFPPSATAFGGAAILTIALYDAPHDLTIAQGLNRGTPVSYVNIVSALEEKKLEAGRIPAEIEFSPGLTERHAGFALLLQEAATGRILAAGAFRRDAAGNSPSGAAPAESNDTHAGEAESPPPGAEPAAPKTAGPQLPEVSSPESDTAEPRTDIPASAE